MKQNPGYADYVTLKSCQKTAQKRRAGKHKPEFENGRRRNSIRNLDITWMYLTDQKGDINKQMQVRDSKREIQKNKKDT